MTAVTLSPAPRTVSSSRIVIRGLLRCFSSSSSLVVGPVRSTLKVPAPTSVRIASDT